MFGSSNRIIIQKQTSKTKQKLATKHKTKLLLWPFQSSDLQWGELKRRSTVMELWIWRSGVILDEGMVSDLVSGVLLPHQALQENI